VADAPEPDELLALCLQIERRCGRERRGPDPEARTLDLDVLLYDQRVIERPELRVPHPRLHQRRFVLRPLAEIDPDRVHPEQRRTMAQLLAALPENEGVWILAPPPELKPET
jgi:2-amino-4-hydroxy-6-hydroxymethyldihydropteridine diphosphokinase